MADKVLIFQTDTLLLKGDSKGKGGILDFIDYDYIGAPWHVTANAGSNIWLRRTQRHGGLREGVGNGGLSLRDVPTMLRIAQKFGCDILIYPVGWITCQDKLKLYSLACYVINFPRVCSFNRTKSF